MRERVRGRECERARERDVRGDVRREWGRARGRERAMRCADLCNTRLSGLLSVWRSWGLYGDLGGADGASMLRRVVAGNVYAARARQPGERFAGASAATAAQGWWSGWGGSNQSAVAARGKRFLEGISIFGNSPI